GRPRGSLVALEAGEVTAWALNALADRGTFFIRPGTRVYPGMVVGEHTREADLEVNVCKKKHVTNMRSATADEAIRLPDPRILSLDEALEFLGPDELLEVTPQHLRLRKAVLDSAARRSLRKAR
ncbi:MAG: translational GTPase TypA, partial [Thermaerobacter sp.]|nr:translational GTPase TypA [Thermaerobacter sp.]